MTTGPRVAALALALALGALPAGAADYRKEIVAHVIDPCFLRLAHQRPIEGLSPETTARVMTMKYADELDRLVDRIGWQIAVDTPAVARRQIYRVALRSCIRQGGAIFGQR